MQERESMSYDVVIVGAGPAGLAAAIRLKQLAAQQHQECRVCVLEKGAEVGSHILSGAVLDPKSLNELIPNWRERNISFVTPVTDDRFLYLNAQRSFGLPVPPLMRNQGHFIISLGALCRFLAQEAESLGVEIYPGFAASELIFDETHHRVLGVATGDMGVEKSGEPGPQFQRGMALLGKQTIFAEGCRGSLTKQLIHHYHLAQHCDPQTYGLGIKEIWQISDQHHQPGLVIHTLGWPLDHKTYGGSFIYHWGQDNLVTVGFVVGLDYQNPTLSPFEEMQRFKTHSAISPILTGGKRIAYGARALIEGGWQSIPRLSFPGGLIIGDSAGLMNVAKIKGIHNALKSGMLAAETLFEDTILLDGTPLSVNSYPDFNSKIKSSWIGEELYRVRNIRPAFHGGLWPGLIYSAIDQFILRGKAPWTFHHQADHSLLKPLKSCTTLVYPKPDGVLTFDRLSSVQLTGVYHNENQPCHLKLTDPNLALTVNYQQYGGPEGRYCPAGVYEFITTAGQTKLQINASNCIHCKTCDIKDPMQNINWQAPEGGGGPNYSQM